MCAARCGTRCSKPKFSYENQVSERVSCLDPAKHCLAHPPGGPPGTPVTPGTPRNPQIGCLSCVLGDVLSAGCTVGLLFSFLKVWAIFVPCSYLFLRGRPLPFHAPIPPPQQVPIAHPCFRNIIGSAHFHEQVGGWDGVVAKKK